jgi:hypothetical protein
VSEPLHDEVLDGLPVLPDEPSGAIFPASASRALSGPVANQVHTAAAAAGGFVAGAALLGLVHRRHNKRATLASTRTPRRIGRASKRSKAVGQIVEVAATRSFLVDVHLLGSPGRHR